MIIFYDPDRNENYWFTNSIFDSAEMFLATSSISHIGVDVAPQIPTESVSLNQLGSTSLLDSTK